MKKAVNHYRVLDRGYCLARRLDDFESAIDIVNFILTSRGFNRDTIKVDDFTYWFKDNEYKVRIVAYPANYIVDADQAPDNVNTVLAKIKSFNGKALKYNALDLVQSRYKPGTFQPSDIRFAESVNWSKGKSIIFKQLGKKKFNGADYETASKVAQLNPNIGTFDSSRSLQDVIRNLLITNTPTEIYKQLKGKVSISNTQLNKLIYKTTH